MYPKVNKTSNVIKSTDTLNNSVTIDEKTDDVIKISYPLSFLLLESEEDSFVKGYN